MKKIFSFLMLLTLFCGVGWAAEESTTIESTNQAGTQLVWSNENLTFSFTTSPSSASYSVETSDPARGLGTGAKTGTHVLTSNQAFSSITKVEVTASTNGSGNTISVSVGDVAFGDAQAITSGTANANKVYSFENTTGASGNVVITISDNNKSVWIKTIKVTYEGGSEPPVTNYQTIPYTESFNNTQGKFTIDEISDGGIGAVWAATSNYGMRINAQNCTSDVESWLISPLIDGTTVSAINLTFDENVRFFADDNAVAQEASLWVREENGTWTQVTIPATVHKNMNNWNFVNVGNIDLSAYAGKIFQIAFKYTATTNPGSWELKNLAITAGVEPPTEVATVAEFNTLDQGKEFVFTGTGLIATAQKGKYLYAQDETGGMLIYGTITPEYALGDIIPAGFSAKKGAYNGAPQAGDPADFEDAVDSGTITAKEFVAADFAASTFEELSNFGIYGVVRGVTVDGNTITLADGTTVVSTFNTFAEVPENTSGKVYDVYGIMGWRNGAAQFLPVDYGTGTATNHAAPVITVNPVKDVYFVGDVVTVTITSEETGVNIGYDITDAATFPETYTQLGNGDSFTVTVNEPDTVTVRAFAYGYEAGDALGNSEVVTKELVFITQPEAGDSYEIVTSADQIAADNEYVLVSPDNTYAMGPAWTGTGNARRTAVAISPTEFEINDGMLTLMSTTTVTPFTLVTGDSTNCFNIKIDGDQYLNWTSGNTVVTGDAKGEVTVELDTLGCASIKFYGQERYLQFNSNSGQERFAFYTGGQKNCYLYVKKAETPAIVGDVNGDGDVNVMDITALIDIIMNDITDNPRADVNGDNNIDVMDITALIDIIMNS